MDEMADAIIQTWQAKAIVRRSILKKMILLASQMESGDEVDVEGRKILAACVTNIKARKYLDSALAQLYNLFSPPVRSRILEGWLDRGTASAGYRWLKAIKSDPLLFSYDELKNYWLRSGNPNAAALLANRCDSSELGGLLSELVERCDQGWIVSRAAVRTDRITDEVWQAIETKFPSTFVYLCAKKHIAIEEVRALRLFMGVLEISIFGQEGGLMIWSFGQLQMWGLLDKIRDMLPEARRDAQIKIISSI